MTDVRGPLLAPKKPPPTGDHEPPPKRKRFWLRFTLASVLIVAVTAAATAASILLYIDSIAHALAHNNRLSNKLHKALAEAEGEAPETFLILGSDKRANLGEERGRSDTTILLRVDPEDNLISVLSIPRDLKVDIPGAGIAKFNAAYSIGGPQLTLRLVKELTGLSVNHVVNVDFLGFVRAVDAIGCVYTDVDRRYYHSNLGVPPAEQYSEINIQPGYQLLCGKKALEFVRYRHTDTDLVRSARQQEFISEARERVSLKDLVFDQSGLIDIFTKYTTSDINNRETMLQVLKLFLAARNASVKQIHFPATLGPSYVYASEAKIHGAVREFLAEPAPTNHLPTSAGKKKSAAGRGKRSHRAKPSPPPPSSELTPAVEAGESQGHAVARKESSGFPVYYPTQLPPGGFFVEDDSYEHIQNPRVYHLRDTENKRHAAYRMVGAYTPEDGELRYFGFQGIQGWSNPPILENSSETQTIGGREYQIFYDGEAIKMIAWHRGDDTYWIANTLVDNLTNAQMVGLARSSKLIVPKGKPKTGGKRG
jgi:polyisoprenyl-teichoic acid--peptidoglycan teichoic acid transferase